jgi:uncharacterized protein YacL
MSRTVPELQPISNTIPPRSSATPGKGSLKTAARLSRKGIAFYSARLFFAAGMTALCYKFVPFGLSGLASAGVGIVLALLILLAELQLRRAATGAFLGGAIGTLLGIFSAFLLTLIISRTAEPDATKNFLEYTSLFAFVYLGLVLGSQRGATLKVGALSDFAFSKPSAPEPVKLLDTSVLIDGRIADICEAHFLDGVLAVPQFVLHELQLVADSSDSLRRQRGRRGLEVLQRMQKMADVDVRVIEQDSFQADDVDHKLVELARRLGAKIVTNDFNLNKVATVQGISILNVNQLANALKPVVLPGEPMRVLILREGKEPNQGVAYLDDGTMVVVDGARRLINRSVDILVTSVHQTTAGKMIFGRLEDRSEQLASAPRQAAAAAGRGANLGAGRANFAGREDNAPTIPEQPQLERTRGPLFPEPDTD